jgi:molybdate transport system substrate-binding protein
MASARGNRRRTPRIVPHAPLVAFCLLLVACGPAPTPTTGVATGSPARITGALTVFAAASLTDAFDELKRQLEAANPGAMIAYNFAASSTLETQLEQGAKADLFASADQPQMDKAKQAGVIQGEDRVFVQNRPVIVVLASNPRNIARPQDLANPGVKLVLAAPQVPIGNYARQILDSMGRDPAYGADFARRAQGNVVSEEANVRQVVGKVQLGEGDAGIVYSSDVTPAVRDQLRAIPIPDDVNVIARYPVAVVKGAANEAGARAFVDYLVSPAGQAILERWGFIPLDQSGNAPAPRGSASSAAGFGIAGRDA